MLHWFDPVFPVNIIYNLINFFISFLIVTFFALKFKIKKNFFILLILFLTTPFFINGFLMEWWQLPDQSKYLKETIHIRHFEFKFLDGRIELFFPSLIFALAPFPFIESFNDIGFVNRLLFSLLIIFLIHKKKVKDELIYYLILSPSLLLYSSTALKETLVIIFIIFSLYAIIEKNFFYFIL